MVGHFIDNFIGSFQFSTASKCFKLEKTNVNYSKNVWQVWKCTFNHGMILLSVTDITFHLELLFQLCCPWEPVFFPWRVCTRIKECSINTLICIQSSFFHLIVKKLFEKSASNFTEWLSNLHHCRDWKPFLCIQLGRTPQSRLSRCFCLVLLGLASFLLPSI